MGIVSVGDALEPQEAQRSSAGLYHRPQNQGPHLQSRPFTLGADPLLLCLSQCRTWVPAATRSRSSGLQHSLSFSSCPSSFLFLLQVSRLPVLERGVVLPHPGTQGW